MKNEKVLTLVEGAVMVALATVLSFVKIVHLPWGRIDHSAVDATDNCLQHQKRCGKRSCGIVCVCSDTVHSGLCGRAVRLGADSCGACGVHIHRLYFCIYGAGACGNFQKIRNARSDWRKRYGYGSAPCVPLYKRSADIRLIRRAVERLYRKRALSLQPAL